MREFCENVVFRPSCLTAAELHKKMGPEFAALIDIEKHIDLDSPDGQEIASIVASLGESCGQE